MNNHTVESEIKSQVQPDISVLMSVHNGSEHIQETMDSILNQSFPNFEFIIVNDASTDDTGKILSTYNDPRLKIITNTENLGLTKSLNKGLEVARAKYIARTDADDISLPERLALQKDFLDTHPEIACVGSSSVIINKDGKVTGLKNPPTDPELLKFFMMLKNQITHTSTMFLRSVAIENGSYDTTIRYAQDYDLWSRLLRAGYKFSNISNPLVQYRFHQSSITQGPTKRTAYESARETVYKNISHYLQVDRQNILTLIEALHMHRVNSIHEAYTAHKTLLRFMRAYIKKENMGHKNREYVAKYINTETKGIWKWYIKYRFGIIYKTATQTKKFFIRPKL